jgi:ABC-type Zn uptake system ZnuABC Zn-binding protein ZnuA
MEEVEESTQEMQESMKAWAEFIKDVTFDEQDVKDVISYWGEINALDVSDEEEVVGMDEEEEEMIDFEELLAFPEYRSWAKSKGLDPDVWLKKFMRIQAMIMKDAMGGSMDEGQAQMQEQIQALEAQRAQLGEEMYQQMKAAMEAGAAAMAGAQSAYADLPDPTAAEKAILDRYRDQLMNLE